MLPATLSPLPFMAAHPGAAAPPRPPAFWSTSPVPLASAAQPPTGVVGTPLPPWPAPGEPTAPGPLTGSPLDFPKPAPAARAALAAACQPLPREGCLPLSAHPTLLAAKLPPLAQPASLPPAPDARDFTDADLREALGPLIRQAVRDAVYAAEDGMDTYLEPMLRATIRRALAEYTPCARPFRPPGLLDRLFWRLVALVTSRSYEDIVFEKTHRFQVEEVFLLDVNSLAMISYASNDPARHSAARRIESTVMRLALQVRDPDGKLIPALKLPDERTALTRKGRFGVLVAVTRGTANELLLADLEFALRRIEDRFRARLEATTEPLLYELQPFLEDCLLIQAPAAA